MTVDAPARPAYLAPLTALRFFAALWVVFFHHGQSFLILAPAFAKDVQKVGYVGVALFFLLSGFVLAYNYLEPFERGGVTRGAFYRARFARVYPLYLFALLVTFPRGFLDPVGAILRLGLLQAWHPYRVGEWNLPSWSLSAEAFFYLLFPFVLPLLARLPRRALLPSFLGCVLLALLPPVLFLSFRDPSVRTAVNQTDLPTAILKFNPLLRLPDFLAGALLGVALVRLDLRARLVARPWSRRGLLVVSLVLVATLVEARRHIPWELLHNGLFLVPFALLFLALAPGEGTAARMLSYRLPVFLGEASYALYLVHVPFHDWLEGVLVLDEKTFFPLYLGLLILCASVLHVVVERPARRLLRARMPDTPVGVVAEP